MEKDDINLFALLIDNCDKDQRLYTDFSGLQDYAKTDTPLQQSQTIWGKYAEKPEKQAVWDQAVQMAIESIETEAVQEFFPFMTAPQMAEIDDKLDTSVDIRPRIFDRISKEHILLDSGAQVSVWPKTYFKSPEIDSLELKAVNKSKLSTYGSVTKSVQIEWKTYRKKVIIADVEKPILGQDFIAL